MPKERKPGWLYFKSLSLNKEYAFHKESGWVYFEDGVKYSPEELKLMDENGATIDAATHNVKLVFKGSEVVGYEPRARTNDKGKQVKSGGGKNNAVNSNSGAKVPGLAGGRQAVEYGELEIY
jgi:hypothetical protein